MKDSEIRDTKLEEISGFINLSLRGDWTKHKTNWHLGYESALRSILKILNEVKRKAKIEEIEWTTAHPERCKGCWHLKILHSQLVLAMETGFYKSSKKCLLDTCNCTEFEKED